MSLDARRSKVLYGIGAARGHQHRYNLYRWVVGVLFTAAVAILPLADVLRFDLWSGRHVVLGEEVDFVTAARAFAFPFLAVNVVIVVVSRFLGRYLCGFVCPVGSLGRLGEWFRWRRKRRGARGARLGLVMLPLACILLTAITFSFWVDWRVFREGSTLAVSLSVAFLVGGSAALLATVDRLGLRFCRDLCPSGVYFAVLGPKTWNGIEFAHPETCTECKACDAVCPMDLEPKLIAEAPVRGGSGFYPDALSNHALCIRCGDCVAACEGTTAHLGVPTPLRMGMLEHESGDAVHAASED